MRLRVLLFALAAAVPGGDLRAALPCDLPLARRATVARVLDGETLRLDDGGEVRLLGILAPRPPAWLRKRDSWPPAEAARAALAGLAEGAEVALHRGAPERDRRGRALAQIVVGEAEGGFWLQGRMVASGQARAYAFSGNRACAAPLLALEAEARRARKGLWRSRAYRVLDAARPDDIAKRLQTFQIVEGRVAAVGRAQRWRFLNFGSDWKRDFTVAVAAADQAGFEEAGLDPAALRGARVRVRGWVERWNGPAIKLTHPDQIEILEPAAPPAARPAGEGQ